MRDLAPLPALVWALVACSETEAPDKATVETVDTGDSIIMDSDNDGTPDNEDCAPADPDVHPGASEVCNGVDDDCDGTTGANPIDGQTYYRDQDGDGYAGDTDPVLACDAPDGYGRDPVDCDDDNPNVHPDADEACDLIDTDCDGEPGPDEWDGDGDGYAACEECDDALSTVFPGADETCNGMDDDCDGLTDEGHPWYPDLDGDGFGDEAAVAVLAGCDDPPDDHVDDATDCDDSDADVYPGSAEEATSMECMVDRDGDGYGDALAAAPYDAGTDCDDENPETNPGAVEVCDALDVDEDCDGLSDDEDTDVLGTLDYAPDLDGDGYGDETAALEPWCDPPSTLVTDATDCDDTDPNTYPGASESGAGLLSDPACDGSGGSLANADHTFIGEARLDEVGNSFGTAGDVDGDGMDDLLIGASTNDDGGSNAGKAYLIYASTLSASSSTSLNLSNADVAFIGEEADDRAGAVSSAGDVDGDGLADLLIGAYGNDEVGVASGKAYLLLGSSITTNTTGIIDLSDADFAFTGEGSVQHAGSSMGPAGDVDGDGLADILIGAALNSDGAAYAGKAYLILGSSIAASTSTTVDLADADFAFTGENVDDYAGGSLTSGDFDGDGYTDIAIGSWANDDAGSSAGKVYVVFGSTIATHTSTTLELADADIAFLGEAAGDAAGYHIGTGDIDGDGLDDLLISAAGNSDGGTDCGKGYVVYGSTLAATSSGSTLSLGTADLALVGEHAGDRAGAIHRAGDIDGDGQDDLLMGSSSNGDAGTGAGKAYLVLATTLLSATAGTLDLANADYAFTGEETYDAAGVGGPAGDVNGDGRDDFLISAPYNDDGGTSAGKLYLILNSL